MPEQPLSAQTRLCLAADLRMRFGANGHVLVDTPTGAVIDAGPRGLTILSLFVAPVPLGDVVAQLEEQRAVVTDFAQVMGVINLLIEEAALVDPGFDTGPTRGWADPVEHARMLYDQRRTGDYLTAIAAGVKPGDVVVEIGTGSGVLAIAAARAGARRVYAIEASDIGPVAQRSFERNGVADVVTLVRGWSRHVTLPELADVLVSEVIGNEPLEEEILETTLDARQRLLRPDGLLLPNALHLHARPLRLPDADHQQRAIGQRSVREWQDRYAMDFTALLDAADPGPVNMPTEGEVASTWPVVGPTMRLASVDLTSFDQATVTGQADLSIAVGNQVNAVAVTFRADLLDDVGHELDPWRWPMSSWATSVWVLPDTIEMARSARLRVTYRRRVAGQLDGLDAEVVTAD